MHQVGDQPRLYYDAPSTNHQDLQRFVLHKDYTVSCDHCCISGLGVGAVRATVCNFDAA